MRGINMQKHFEIEDAIAVTPAIVTEEGSYKLLEYVNVTENFAGVYKALFTSNNSNTEERVVIVKHNKILEWHSI
jgi:hypothetical protein